MTMVFIEKCLIITIGISLVTVELSYAQPTIFKENIPKDASPEVKKEIENLYSPDALERAEAAIRLGWMGSKKQYRILGALKEGIGNAAP